MSSAIPWLFIGSIPFFLGGDGSTPQHGGGGGTGPSSGGPSKPPAPISIEDGLAWAKALPSKHGPEREAAILDAVVKGGANLSWTSIQSGPIAGYRATILVAARSLRIGKRNPVRVEVDYTTHQKLCDHFGCTMLTPHVSNLIWQKAGLRVPYLQKSDWVVKGTMATTANMIAYSQELDAGDKNAARPPIPVDTKELLIANEGKDWVIAKRLWKDNIDPSKSWDPAEMTRADLCWSANYGWYQPNSVPVQPVGKKHNFPHTDYSQEWRAMHSVVIIEGPQPIGAVPVASVLRHPVLCQLLSDEGPLPDCKHPFFGTTKAPVIPLDITA